MLVTCRSNDVTSLEVTLLEVTSLTNDVGHLPVTSSYVTYYYYNYYRVSKIKSVKSKGLYLGNEALLTPSW